MWNREGKVWYSEEEYNELLMRQTKSDLIEALTKYTDEELGSWSILYNDHTTCYCKDIDRIKEYYQPTCKGDIPEWEEDVKGIDWSKPIYQLYWFKDNPVGNYSILSNSLADLYKNVLNIVKEDE